MQARPAPVALEDLVVLVLTLLFLIVPLLVGVVRAIRKEVEKARREAAPGETASGEAAPGGKRLPPPVHGLPPRTAPAPVPRQAPAWTEPLRFPVPAAAAPAAAGRGAEPREAHRAPPRPKGGWARLERLPPLQRGLLLAELLGPPVALREEGLPPLRPPPRLSAPAGGAPPGASPAATPRRA